MTQRGDWADLIDKLNAPQLELAAAVLGLAVILQRYDTETRDWALDGLARLVNGEGPEGLEIWADAIDGLGWE